MFVYWLRLPPWITTRVAIIQTRLIYTLDLSPTSSLFIIEHKDSSDKKGNDEVDSDEEGKGPGRTVFVTNLPFFATEEYITRIFSVAGDVEQVGSTLRLFTASFSVSIYLLSFYLYLSSPIRDGLSYPLLCVKQIAS